MRCARSAPAWSFYNGPSSLPSPQALPSSPVPHHTLSGVRPLLVSPMSLRGVVFATQRTPWYAMPPIAPSPFNPRKIRPLLTVGAAMSSMPSCAPRIPVTHYRRTTAALLAVCIFTTVMSLSRLRRSQPLRLASSLCRVPPSLGLPLAISVAVPLSQALYHFPLCLSWFLFAWVPVLIPTALD